MPPAPPTLPLSLPLAPLLLTPSTLQSLTLSLLHSPSTTLAPQTPALSVLLFLLDGLSFLRSDPLLARLAGGELGWEEDGEREVEWKRVSQGGGFAVNVTPGAGEKGFWKEDEEVPSWDEWRTYISEMYLYPLPPTSPPSTPASTWRSPFHLPPSLIPSLPHLCQSLTSTAPPPHIGTLRTCLLSALFHLSTEPPTLALAALLSPSRSSSKTQVGGLLPAPVVHSITSTLASLRRSRQEHSLRLRSHSRKNQENPLQTFRSILSTLLGVWFPQLFGVKPGNEGGEMIYARDREVEGAVVGYWVGFEVEVEVEVEGDWGEEEEDEELGEEVRRTSMGGGVTSGGEREARRSILRKDDKLRWIFGDNFQNRRLSTPNSSPPSRRQTPPKQTMSPSSSTSSIFSTPSSTSSPKTRPLSLSSIDSPSFSQSTHSTHKRGHSISSTTPLLLLPPPSPPSSHKSPHAPSSPTPFSSLTSFPLSSSSLSSSSHSNSTNQGFSFLPTPPTTNDLSPKKKRELVRKSRKLNKLFGVPLEEEAAGVVLVKVKGRERERRMSFPGLRERPSQISLVSTSTAMGRSTSSPSWAHPYAPSPLSPDFPFPLPPTERNERRKKMDKLWRLLGEKVPSELVGSLAGGSASSISLPGMEEWRESAEIVGERGVLGMRRERGGVREMNSARKLEQMFGQLPPRSLFLPSSHTRSLSSPPLTPLPIPPSRRIESYRASIKSLQYLAERDLQGLDQVVGGYGFDSEDEDGGRGLRHQTRGSLASSVGSAWEMPDEVDGEGSDEEEEEEEVEVLRGEKSEGRTARKAIKLANLLGTTKGEVWTMLLNDLATAVREEEDLDEDEREEVLGGVAKLRLTGERGRGNVVDF